MFPSSFFLLAPGDGALGLAVRCPACRRTSVNLVSHEHVDVPFHNDREVGVVEHVFADDVDATLDEFRARALVGRRSTPAGWRSSSSRNRPGGFAVPSRTRQPEEVIGMRRYGLYDATRGLTLAARGRRWPGCCSGLRDAGRHADDRPLLGSHRRSSRARGSCSRSRRYSAAGRRGSGCGSRRARSCSAFLPVLVVVGWILMATQPGNGWHEGRSSRGATSIGVIGVVHALGLWHGVLAFGLGLVLGLRSTRCRRRSTVDDGRRRGRARDPVGGGEPGGRPSVADEPLTAERDAAAHAEPHTVTVGPRSERATETVE